MISEFDHDWSSVSMAMMKIVLELSFLSKKMMIQKIRS